MRLNAFWGDSREMPHGGGAGSLLPSQGSPVPSCGSYTRPVNHTLAKAVSSHRDSETAVTVTNRDLSGPLSPLPENKERRRMRSMNGQQAPPVCGAPGSSLGFPASSPPRHLQRKPERTLRASRTCSLLARGRGGGGGNRGPVRCGRGRGTRRPTPASLTKRRLHTPVIALLRPSVSSFIGRAPAEPRGAVLPLLNQYPHDNLLRVYPSRSQQNKSFAALC